MKTPFAPEPHSASRLAALLSRCEAWPDAEVLAEARLLGPGPTAALVNVLLAGLLRAPAGDRTVEHACLLAGALRLDATLPRLLSLVDSGRTPAATFRAAMRAIGGMGLAALEPVNAALETSRAEMERHRSAGHERRFSAAVARLGRHLEAAAALHAAIRAEPGVGRSLEKAEALARGRAAG